ncbi:MAG TPA: hypothetical protein VFE46_03985 [Pirellulales bacterium]|jgi:hypothetical protein|nr:hypothetical protein [Pirellulales bacterium]
MEVSKLFSHLLKNPRILSADYPTTVSNRCRLRFDDDDDQERRDPDYWDDLDDDDPFDPEPFDDKVYDDFEFEAYPDESELPPDELLNDADWE